MFFSGNQWFRAIFVQYMIFRKIWCFWTVTYVSFRFSVFFTFWSRFEALLMVLWNFVCVFLVIFQLLNEFCWFSWFWAILHPWREQSNTGSDKNECVSIHFRRSVDGACFWPMQHRDSYFLWSFCNEFSTILSTFCIHDVSKATPGRTKMNAIWCIFAGQATACVFDHCNTGVYVFSCSFCGDFRCILASFCMILSTYLEAWSRYMNGPRSRSKRVIFITFSRVFDTSKIEISVTLAGFLGK